MRDEVNTKAVLCHLVDRQAHPVECHRALWGDEARQFLRHLEDKPYRFGFGPALDDPRQTVDMAQNEVPAKLVTESQRSLEIDRGAHFPLAERCAYQSFDRRLDSEC